MQRIAPVLVFLLVPLFAVPQPEMLKGTILSVDEDYCGKSADYLLRAVLSTGARENAILVLAPKWYLHSRKIEIKAGQRAEVRAIRAEDKTYEVITIKIGKNNYILRDGKGKPVWQGEPGNEDLFKSICRN